MRERLCRHGDPHAVEHRRDVELAGLREDDQDLLVGQTSDNVERAQEQRGAADGLAQHRVAGRAAEGLVDVRKAFDVEQADAELGAVTQRPRQLRIEATHDRLAAADAGQRVVAQRPGHRHLRCRALTRELDVPPAGRDPRPQLGRVDRHTHAVVCARLKADRHLVVMPGSGKQDHVRGDREMKVAHEPAEHVTFDSGQVPVDQSHSRGIGGQEEIQGLPAVARLYELVIEPRQGLRETLPGRLAAVCDEYVHSDPPDSRLRSREAPRPRP